MLVSTDQGRDQLEAAGFSPDTANRSDSGEFWLNPSGYPTHFLQHCGPNKDCFDAEQLALVLSQGGKFKPGKTIGPGGLH